ncbi:hemerythrin domain-containing protein [Undibacterium fentianense]|uniref:Hemerythrin domain-containing protein n=1 Tax=Undibacterium fentianense TaxID=2828728 RepID=A0A941IBL1_9BURK|nr:hemerythrin domain-containing protein [Undibacterium fentianense]MBR7799174.1 hemerythrin domain-containing protein [Undibacterium fentianense]
MMATQKWEWSDRLRLKHQLMDATHQEFVTLCAALSMHEDGEPFLVRLDMLIQHSIEHFEQENQWMRDFGFPPAACHQGEHDAVLQVMQEVRRRFAEGEKDLGQSLAEELPLWFEHHVDTMDNMLAQFMISNQLAMTEEEKGSLAVVTE